MPKKDIKNLVPIFPESAPLRVKFKDIFDLKGFYESLREWLLEHDWGDEEEKTEHWESYYGERIGQTGAREIWFLWRVMKAPEGANYIRYYMDFDFHCLAIVDTEVIKDGKKIKMNKGEIEMKIWPYMEERYKTELSKHKFIEPFLNLFSKRIYRREALQKQKQLYQEVYVLQNWIKQWFKLKRYHPYEEYQSFMPSSAYPSHMKE